MNDNSSFPFSAGQMDVLFQSSPSEVIRILGVNVLCDMLKMFWKAPYTQSLDLRDEVRDELPIQQLSDLITKSPFARDFRYLFYHCEDFYTVYYTMFWQESESLYHLCSVIGLGNGTDKPFQNKFEAAKALIDWVTFYKTGKEYAGQYNTTEKGEDHKPETQAA